MTTYQEIGDAEIAPGAPGTSSLFMRLRDNLLAIISAAPGAPKILGSALSTLPAQNLFQYPSAGTYSIAIPLGVESIEADAVGAGGGSKTNGTSVWCGGGAERRLGRIATVPGETLTVVVGSGGVVGAKGGDSYVMRGATVLMHAIGGNGAITTAAGNGGTGGIGGVGFDGERGGRGSTAEYRHPGGGAPHGGNGASNGSGGWYDYMSGKPGIVTIRY